MTELHVPDGVRFVRAIGTGTFFDVALVEEGDRLLACKRIRPRLLRDPIGRAALAREVKALAAISHPSVPAVVRVGNDGHGPFVLETFSEGASLEAVRTAWEESGRAVPDELFLHVAKESVRVLAELHALAVGFVHGDLAPDNVLLAPTGRVHLLDFGMTRVQGVDPGGEGRGTLPFAAPELARGEIPSDAACDVYALAASLLWLVREDELASRDAALRLVEVSERGIDPKEPASLGPAARPAWKALREATRFERGERTPSASALLAAL